MSDEQTRAPKIAADIKNKLAKVNPQAAAIPRVITQSTELTPEQTERLKKAFKRLEDFKDM